MQTQLPLPSHTLSNYSLIMLPSDIPASLSCITPALLWTAGVTALLCYTEHGLSCTGKQDGTADWWLQLSPADCCRQRWDAWCLLPESWYATFIVLLPIPGRKRKTGLTDDTFAWRKKWRATSLYLVYKSHADKWKHITSNSNHFSLCCFRGVKMKPVRKWLLDHHHRKVDFCL